MGSTKHCIEFNGVKFYRSRKGYYSPHVPDSRRGAKGLHVEVWQSVHGPVPPGYHVHHIDRDPSNNSIDNLECLSPAEHAALHARIPTNRRAEHMARITPLAAAWHGTPEGKAFHSAHSKRMWATKKPICKICERCGSEFETLIRRADNRFCSEKCRREIDRTCIQCGTVFTTYRSEPGQHCSKKCAWITRRANRNK